MSELVVYLDGQRCGVLVQSPSGNLTFQYDEDYRRGDEPTPLSLSMPLAAASHKKRVILPYLQGLLPDSEDALAAIGTRYLVSPRSPFALLQHVGSDVAGAVQIAESGTAASDATRARTTVETVDDAGVGKMLRHVISEYSDGVPYYDSVGHFSLAGAQPKIALHKGPGGEWGVPQDATPTTHILKPVSGAIRRIDVNELVTLRAAKHLGNDVADSELQTIDGLDVFVTERYDRKRVGRDWRRLHQEDLCQALSVSPQKKYQHREGGPGLGAVAALIKTLPSEADRRDVGQKFYRAFVFNVVAGCTDAHAKNYSLLLEGASVRLAPLYDLVTYAPYWDGRSRLDSAMSIGGEYSIGKITEAMLLAAGRQFGLTDEAAEIVAATRAGMVGAFEAAVETLMNPAPDVRTLVSDLMKGVRSLPLVDQR